MSVAFKIDSFVDGMNQQFEATKLQKTEYPLLINGRSRYNIIEPIKKPDPQAFPIAVANVQSIYAANTLVLAFADGKAFYKDLILNTQFIQIPGFQMDANVASIYAELVPASTINFKRQSVNGNASSVVNLTDKIGGSPLCVLCQDGVNQPWLIFPDGSTRITQNYNQWTVDNREYVPVGTFMFYGADGVLYIVSPDKKRILRSVTGRPLDFVIIIDVNGDKLPLEQAGGADASSHAFSYNKITAISRIPAPDATFFASTATNTELITPRQDSLIFGEPTFRNTPLTSTGVQNPYCVVDILGDTAFIDMEGIKEFNSVLQLKYEGNNSPFSAKISKLFNGIKQSNTACTVSFNDYSMFSVDTVFGPAVILYDNIMQRYVGLDIYAGVAKIKQFASARVDNIRRLFFITVDNKCYEAFAGANFETCQHYIGEFAAGDSGIEQVINSVKLTLTEVFEDGTIYASIYEDSVKNNTILHENVTGTSNQQVIPVDIPNGQSVKDSVRNVMFNFKLASKLCWKVGVLLSWNFNAKLSNALIECDTIDLPQSFEQGAQKHLAVKQEVAIISQFAPLFGPVGKIVSIIGSGFIGVSKVNIGNVQCPFSIVSNNLIKVTIPNDAITGKFRFEKNESFTYSDTEFTVNP